MKIQFHRRKRAPFLVGSERRAEFVGVDFLGFLLPDPGAEAGLEIISLGG